jgi:hypothetical protein
VKVLDLFSGLGGWAAPFREAGHEVTTLDFDPRFGTDIIADVLEWPIPAAGAFDIILASPPCEKFSVLAIGRHWLPGYKPKHEGTLTAIAIVRRTVEIIEAVAPAFYVVENPVGMLRKLNLLPYERQTVTYCQYGAPWRKPTDLWGGFPPSLTLRPRCRNGDPCHIAAARGSRSGTQSSALTHLRAVEDRAAERARGVDDATDGGAPYLRVRAYQSHELYGTWNQAEWAAKRAEIPYELANDVRIAAERDLAAGLAAPAYSGRLFA